MMLSRHEQDEGPQHLNFSEATSFDNDVSLSTDVEVLNPEKMMAQELGLLERKHRDAIHEEIHGVSTMAIEETPELLETSLRNFQTELDRIDPGSRFAYDIISSQDSNPYSRQLVAGPAFRLRFLRSVLFRPREAAQRMVVWLQILNAVYGHEALLRFDASMDFFVGERDVQNAFRAGYFQTLPFRDRSGRKIFVMITDALKLDDTIRVRNAGNLASTGHLSKMRIDGAPIDADCLVSFRLFVAKKNSHDAVAANTPICCGFRSKPSCFFSLFALVGEAQIIFVCHFCGGRRRRHAAERTRRPILAGLRGYPDTLQPAQGPGGENLGVLTHSDHLDPLLFSRQSHLSHDTDDVARDVASRWGPHESQDPPR